MVPLRATGAVRFGRALAPRPRATLERLRPWLHILSAAALTTVGLASCNLEPWNAPTWEPRGASDPPAICRAPSHCPGEDTECAVRTCVDGFCGVELRDGPTPSQSAGDCRMRRCERGELMEVPAIDAPDDGHECTEDRCVDGSSVHEPFAAGTPCGVGSATHCDGAGECVGCEGDGDCPADTACADWSCASGICQVVPAPVGTACGDPRSCESGTVILPDGCDGLGACQDAGTQSCAGYACEEDGLRCRTQCLRHEECSGGYECLIPGLQGWGECIPAGS